MISEIKGILLTGGVGIPLRILSLCHWMRLVIRNKYVYGLEVGSARFLRYKDFYLMKGWGMTHCQCHCIRLTLTNKNIYS